MLTHFGLDSVDVEWTQAAVCVGTFDGVHLGHRELLGTAARIAADAEMPSVAVTFDRHPAATLAPDRCPPAIASLEEDLEQIASTGISACLVLHFDQSLAQMTAQDFLDRILIGKLKASRAIVGHDFAFGHGREGDPEWLRARFPTTVVPAFLIEGERVSSRRIRELIADGEVESASRLLGRPFRIDGVVVAGQKLGRKLGYPTINLERSRATLMPKHGIYAGRASTPLGDFAAAISIGVRPTIGGETRTIEAFLLNFEDRSLYGAPISLHLLRRLRDELKFDSMEDLSKQMALDVQAVAESCL